MSYELTEDDWARINDPAIQEQLKRKAAELDAKLEVIKPYETEEERRASLARVAKLADEIKAIARKYGPNR